LRQQIDSLLRQEDVFVSILIRDDGSTDGSVGILEGYAKRYDNIGLIEGGNVGVVASFNILMSNPIVDEFEYVGFCDQDDVWLPIKLSAALSFLNAGERDDVPHLYCSNVKVVDEKLNPLKLRYKARLRTNRYTAVVQNCAMGCTQVFNRKAVQLYREGIGKRMEMHDYWMFLVCIYMGQVFWDKNAFLWYRQHQYNVVGAKKKSVRRAITNIQNVTGGKRRKMIADFLNVYSENLDEQSKKILRCVSEESGWNKRFRLIFSPRFHGYDYRTTLGFKFRLLIGRMY